MLEVNHKADGISLGGPEVAYGNDLYFTLSFPVNLKLFLKIKSIN